MLVFEQRGNATLVNVNSVSTGGTGLGTNLGSQGALSFSQDGRWLFAVNAGNDTVSSFAVDDENLTLRSVTSTGGVMPISVTSHGHLVYLLNAGGAGNIAGFRVGHDGTLTPVAGSTQGLGGSAAGPAQVKFSNGGEFLIVTEKTANQIAVFEVDDGLAQPPTLTPSVGNTPFGFDIDPRDHVIVSEAASASASSYRLRDRTDNLAVISAAVPTNQAAPCWLIVTPNGRFAYTGNAGSATITAFAIRRDGTLTRTSASGADGSTGAGSHTIDLAVSDDGQYLYALANVGQTLTAFSIARDGTLAQTSQFVGVPVSTVGLLAR
ncbi:MAG TPA: beta-propeller fold lactonase family protein [Burkholderiaceae bacterium]|nr:beta-propeller fold lactonase family protein [Burkholderiaceae bacterium]